MIIDIHGHIRGPAELYRHLEGFASVSGPAGRGLGSFRLPDEALDAPLAAHLAALDAVGTNLQLVGAHPAALPTADRRTALVIGIAAVLNDLTARCVGLRPGRLAGVGLIPQSPALRPADARAEMRRCVEELGFVGFTINPDPGEGGWEAPAMGDEYWYPIYEELVRLGTPALVHAGRSRLSRQPPLGYACQEESVAAWGLLRSTWVFRDFPTLQLVVAHGGGYIPYQYGRARCFRLNERRDDDETWEPFEVSLGRLWFDTALFDSNALELLLRTCGIERSVFGSSMWNQQTVFDPATGRPVGDVRSLIEATGMLGDPGRLALFESNARTLFRRLEAPVGAHGWREEA